MFLVNRWSLHNDLSVLSIISQNSSFTHKQAPTYKLGTNMGTILHIANNLKVKDNFAQNSQNHDFSVSETLSLAILQKFCINNF